jgi:tight adherence protein B
MRRRAALSSFLVALLALAGLLSVAPGAGAQAESDERIGIREIDATDPDDVAVTFFYSGDRAAAADVAIRQGDAVVEPNGPIVPFDDDRSLGVVLLIEVSQSMNTDAAIERAREAALSFVEEKAPTDQVAVVAFDGTVTVLQGFTADQGLLEAAIEQLAPGSGSARYDAVVRAVSLFDESTLQPNILLLGGSADTSSSANLDRAVGALTRSGTTLFAVGIEGDDFAMGQLERLADDSGGQAVVTDDPAQLEALFAGVQETLRRQYVASFTARDNGATDLTLTIGAAQATAELTLGSRVDGAQALSPTPAERPSGPAFFRSSAGLALGLLLVLLAVGAAVWSVVTTFTSRDESLEATLRPYQEGYVASSDDDDRNTGMAQTMLARRAVGITERFAERQGFLEKVETKLEQANLPLRPAEALLFYSAGAILVVVLVAFLSQSVVVILAIAGLAILLPPAVLSFLAKRRRKAFETLLPDTLQLLASTLRAGYSLMQGVEAVSTEVAEPMGRELRRVVTEARLGRPLEESMEAVAQRMSSPDFSWAVMAIGIQREVGGNLSELLVTVGDTMTERERLRRDVNALTAEGRVSAVILGILPLGIGLFIWSANPGYLDPLFERTAGQIMIGVALVMMLGGFLWMKKIIEIEV